MYEFPKQITKNTQAAGAIGTISPLTSNEIMCSSMELLSISKLFNPVSNNCNKEICEKKETERR